MGGVVIGGIQALINGFETLIKGMKYFIEFVIQLVNNTINLTTYIRDIKNVVTGLINTTPVWLQTFLTLALAITIVMLILGRSSGKHE